MWVEAFSGADTFVDAGRLPVPNLRVVTCAGCRLTAHLVSVDVAHWSNLGEPGMCGASAAGTSVQCSPRLPNQARGCNTTRQPRLWSFLQAVSVAALVEFATRDFSILAFARLWEDQSAR